MMFKLKISLSIIATALLLAGCGGSNNDNKLQENPPPPPQLSPPTTTATTGVITGFGSVYINGIKYETDDVAVSMGNNHPALESDLAVGMVVMLNGHINPDGLTGTALTIHYSDSIKGPLENIDLLGLSLTILGQTVLFDDLTTLHDLTLAMLNPGDHLEISGFTNADGQLYATRIAKQAQAGELQLHGIVSNLDISAGTLMLGDLTINFSDSMFSDFDVSALVDGQVIKVMAEMAQLHERVLSGADISLGDSYYASQPLYFEGDHLEIEGFIEQVDNAGFVVNGHHIIINDHTNLSYGNLADLMVNARIKLKGTYDANGNLVAGDIRFHLDTDLKFDAVIEHIDLMNQMITIMGVSYQVNFHTKFEDYSSYGMHHFSLSDLSPEDRVEVSGFIDSNGQYIATSLIRQAHNDMVEEFETLLKGQATDFTDFGFMIYGTQVHLDLDTMFSGLYGEHMLMSGFFNQYAAGMLIEVSGLMSDGILQASSVEFSGGYNDMHGMMRTELRGTVTELLVDGLVVDGYRVIFDHSTNFQIINQTVTKEQFSTRVSVDSQVKVSGTFGMYGVILAKYIELE